MKTLRVLILFTAGLATAAAQTGRVDLKSPDGSLEISIATIQGGSVEKTGGMLAYAVSFRGKPVIEWSTMGLMPEGSASIGAAVRRLFAIRRHRRRSLQNRIDPRR